MAQDARVKRAHACIVGTREFNFGFLFSPLFLYDNAIKIVELTDLMISHNNYYSPLLSQY